MEKTVQISKTKKKKAHHFDKEEETGGGSTIRAHGAKENEKEVRAELHEEGDPLAAGRNLRANVDRMIPQLPCPRHLKGGAEGNSALELS
jgi:hypothetical protein